MNEESRFPALTVLNVFFAACLILSFSSCEAASDDAADIPPPSQIIGTAAIGGESGTFELNFGTSAQTSGIRARALYAVTGSVIFGEDTFTLTTGQYTSETGAVSGTTSSETTVEGEVFFKIVGVYSEAMGFTGTIAYYLDSALTAVGSLAGVPSTASNPAANYLGTYSGGASGTWNMTIEGSVLVGSYSNYDTEDGTGTYRGTVSGTAITFSSATNSVADVVAFSGGGTITGLNVAGSWSITLNIPDEGEETFSGSWTGTAEE